MALELFVGACMILVTVACHGLGLALLGVVIKVEDLKTHTVRALSIQGLTLTFTTALGIFVIHGIEIALYAATYLALGAVENLRQGVNLSTLSYGGLGFERTMIAANWELLAGIEGLNGVIMLGWSVAFFVTVMNRLKPR